MDHDVSLDLLFALKQYGIIGLYVWRESPYPISSPSYTRALFAINFEHIQEVK